MKCLLFGFGSIGQRHAHNLKRIVPDCHIIMADPFIRATSPTIIGYYASPELAIQHHADADFSIIASPDISHAQQMALCAHWRIPFYVEKPACTPEHLGSFGETIERVNTLGLRCAVGFQYRFHKNIAKARGASSQKHLKFYARDNLRSRYGAQVGGVMLAHPIDTALWCLGPARTVEIVSDGLAAKGKITHNSGAVSEYDCNMDVGLRISRIEYPTGCVDLPPDDSAYVKCLSAYLDWLQTGQRDYRTATLEDGRAVVEVLWKCKSV